MQTRDLLSKHALSRRVNVDPRTLVRLVTENLIRPDFQAGPRQFFLADRVPQIQKTIRSRFEK